MGPFSAAYWISEAMERWDICFYALHLSSMISSVLCVVSLLTLTAISIDRVLALLLGLRHRQIVTLKKTYVVMLIFWVCSIVAATMYIVNTLVTSGRATSSPRSSLIPKFSLLCVTVQFSHRNKSGKHSQPKQLH